MIAYRILSICISIAALTCKSAPETKAVAVADPAVFQTAADLMEFYDASFRSLFYRHAGKAGPDFEQLALMYEFYTKYTIWAKISPDGHMVSLSKGRTHVIFVAYEPGHPALKISGPTLVTVQGQNVEIHIRPDKVSREFAGVLLIHELSHALDKINQTESQSAEANETKAYLHEKKAMNIAYEGRPDKALDAVLDQIKPKDVTDLIRYRETAEQRRCFERMLIGMEKTIVIEPPLSEAEAEMRLGFYAVALELRRQERENTGKTRYSISAEKVGQLLKASSKY